MRLNKFVRVLAVIAAVLIVGNFSTTLIFDAPPNAEILKQSYAEIADTEEGKSLGNVLGLYQAYASKTIVLKGVLFLVLVNSVIILYVSRKSKAVAEELPQFDFAAEQKSLADFYEPENFIYDLPKIDEDILPAFDVSERYAASPQKAET